MRCLHRCKVRLFNEVKLTKFDVVSVEVVDLRLGEHRIVFKFSSSDCGAVVRDQNQLGLSLSQSLKSRLVTYLTW